MTTQSNPFGPSVAADGAPALPLWVDGHAFLMMAERFFTVTAANGAPLRRVPLCGREAAEIIVASAQKALPHWRELPVAARAACFRELHDLIARYRGHLAGLIAEETHRAHDLADAELEQALAAVAGTVAVPGAGAGVAVVLTDAPSPLAGAVSGLVEALAAGWAVILKPSPKAPSALFALAEICTRAGFPPGLVNLAQGDVAVIDGLFAQEAVTAAVFCGSDALAAEVGALARASGTPFVSASAATALLADWRRCLGRPEA